MQKKSIFSFTIDEFRSYLVEHGFARYASDQVFDWLYRKFELDLDKWSNTAKKMREHLKRDLDFSLPTVIWDGLSKDGTRKFLLKMSDGHSVEAVAIPSKTRLTLCVSSQVGCGIGCTFCHTATQGLTRSLTTAEVVGQFMAVTLWLRENADGQELTNIVYMGQGEPLNNYENMKQATLIFMEPKGIGLGQRRITLSTSGLVPQIEQLAEFPPVNIAISLHAAHDHVRSELMPINKVYDLKRLFKAIRTIPLKAHRRITYEYLLIDGLNNGQEDLDALCDLINKRESKINLIPFNEYPGSKFKRPSRENIDWFNGELNRRGYTSTIRTSKGDDILAACGQLKTQVLKKQN
jgi:23S rRNA (adenine2503-C2)-methyltransferase